MLALQELEGHNANPSAEIGATWCRRNLQGTAWLVTCWSMACQELLSLQHSSIHFASHATHCICLKGPTWQQAVQWMEEMRVEAGTHLALLAQHDTYSISFAWQPLLSTHLSHSVQTEVRADAEHDSAAHATYGVHEAGCCPHPEQVVVPLKVHTIRHLAAAAAAAYSITISSVLLNCMLL